MSVTQATLLGDTFGNEASGTIPIGGIIMWSGASVPTGWALCNGSNGTPDLRNRFIVSTGSGYAIGATGGANSVTLTPDQMPAHGHTGSTSAAGAHSHSGTTAGVGDHSHSLSRYSGNSNVNTQSSRYALATTNDIGPDSTQGAGAHSHTFTTNGVVDHTHTVTVGNTGGGEAHENRPPYYALAFIMRVS
jgi:microcystin-dependent protein